MEKLKVIKFNRNKLASLNETLKKLGCETTVDNYYMYYNDEGYVCVTKNKRVEVLFLSDKDLNIFRENDLLDEIELLSIKKDFVLKPNTPFLYKKDGCWMTNICKYKYSMNNYQIYDYNMKKYDMDNIIPLDGNEDLVGTNKESEYIYNVSYEDK